MPRATDYARRDELLDLAADVLAHRGVDTSLRSVAAELGTTSRMMVHYFGSRELLVAGVLAHEEARALAQCTRLSGSASLREGLLALWAQIWVPDEAAVNARLLAQIVGAACGRESAYTEFVVRLTNHMIETLQTKLVVAGLSADMAQFRARSITAALQGFAAQRITSEDPFAVDAAFRRFVDAFVVVPAPPAVRTTQSLPEPMDERRRQSRRR